MNLQNVSVAMLTKNSERFLPQILESLHEFGEVVITDSGSNDATLSIAASFRNVKIYEREFTDFSDMKNYCVQKCTNDTVFSLDSDEIPSKEFLENLKTLVFDSNTLYEIDRVNIFNAKKIKCCGWYPDFIPRIFDKRVAAFDGSKVHEKIVGKDSVLNSIRLKGEVLHYSYNHPREFLEKMQRYTDLYALQNKGKKSSLTKAILHASFTFFKNYILKKGICYGFEGYIISVYNAQTAFWKYIKLHFDTQK